MRRSSITTLLFGGLVLAVSSPAAEAPTGAEIGELLSARCAACHNEKVRSGDLSLAARDSALQGGGRGSALVPGDADASLLIQAVRRSGELKMPPTGPLEAAEVAKLEAWVEAGAPAWAAAGGDANDSLHWSFRPIVKPEPPRLEDDSRARNPIDRFIQARLENEGLKPAPDADKATLIRRVSLDLTGLPPTPAEVQAFLEDDSPDAYERLVDRLLASPHYGERWGRHWLDIAHYADSNGYNQDHPRQIWMYRDWVIQALNEDKPFDEFVIEQVGGDLLPEPTKDQLVATGFHRNTLINLEGGIDFDQYRADAIVDRVDTIGAAFLGLTLGCARCHDHKFDPISQKEFYQMYAFYDSIDELSAADGEAGRQDPFKPTLEFGSPEELAKRDVIRAQLELLEQELKTYEEEVLLPKQAEWEAGLTEEFKAELTDEQRAVLATPLDERNDFQRRPIERLLKKDDLGWRERNASIEALRERLPDLPWTMVMRELDEPRVTHVHLGGDFLAHGEVVQPGTLNILPDLEKRGQRADRLDLGRWIVSDDNPLTARVTVNRVWSRYFGLGLVETENDFGTQGRMPSHPELLDWLAAEFREGWGVKDLHRLIVTSTTYRQASNHREDAEEVDPRNRLLSRQNRLRLEAEIVRDAALVASGLFEPEIGGPSVYPPQPDGASKLGQMQRDWVEDTDKDRYRRGMYTFFWRASPHPGLMIFDAPDSTTACTRRVRSNTPLQALTLLNDEAYYEFAQGLAKRTLEASDDDPLGYAFQVCLAREPDSEERERLQSFLSRRLDEFQTRPDEAEPIAETPELAAWTSLSRVLLNLDEFITRE